MNLFYHSPSPPKSEALEVNDTDIINCRSLILNTNTGIYSYTHPRTCIKTYIHTLRLYPHLPYAVYKIYVHIYMYNINKYKKKSVTTIR